MKWFHRAGAAAVAVCISLTCPAMAAGSRQSSRAEAREACSGSKALVRENQAVLTALREANQEKMVQIIALQNQLKQDGRLTGAHRAELSQLTEALRQQRQGQGNIHREVSASKLAARGSVKDGDSQAALAAYEAAAALQEELVSAQRELGALLDQKLHYLNQCASGVPTEVPVLPEAGAPAGPVTGSPEVPAGLPGDEEGSPDDTSISDAVFDSLLEQAAEI